MRCFSKASLLILILILSACSGQNQTSGSSDSKPSEILISEVDERVNLPECTTGALAIKDGSICGKVVTPDTDKKVTAYLGIPYAESTAADNRWREPVAVKAWDGALKATQFGPTCPQLASIKPQSEDCLTINVWVPEGAPEEPRAVMVFIYGGAFIYGSGADPTYNGAYAASQGDVIVVSFNYRLGALGFLAGLKDKTTGEEINGNFGFLDQILALEWVRDNISVFGGDPAKVTLWGESAGAMSIGLHILSSPGSKGLYRTAIMESNPLGIPYKTLKQYSDISKRFASNLGCEKDDIECMRAKLPEVVLDAQAQKDLMIPSVFHGIVDFLTWAPVVDGEVITSQPITEITTGNLITNIIIGTNKNEGLLFVELVKAAMGKKTLSAFDYALAVDYLIRDRDFRKKVLEKYPSVDGDNTYAASKLITDYLFVCPTLYTAKKSSPDTWSYSFDHISSFNYWKNTPACATAVCHGAELPYVFHTPSGRGFSFTLQESELSDLMIEYWTSFAKASAPVSRSTKWPRFRNGSSTLVFNTPISDINTVSGLDANCSLWDQSGYNLEGSFWGLF